MNEYERQAADRQEYFRTQTINPDTYERDIERAKQQHKEDYMRWAMSFADDDE